MRVTVNGAVEELPDELSLDQLIERLKLDKKILAVELNKEIVRRPEWSSTMLTDSDTLEIVHFVGGG